MGEGERESYLERFGGVESASLRLSPRSRAFKARKIERILGECLRREGRSLAALKCLDIGCGTGLMTRALSAFFKQVVGLDTDWTALAVGREQARAPQFANIQLMQGSAVRLPYSENAFDIVVCAQVYEHVPEAEGMFDEIHRVLAAGGYCYLSATNRFVLVEPHFKLPFLSWLPRDVANIYVRLAGKGLVYSEEPWSGWRLRRALHRFEVLDYTTRVVSDPDRYGMRDVIPAGSFVTKLPCWLQRLLWPLMPTYIMVLRKKTGLDRRASGPL